MAAHRLRALPHVEKSEMPCGRRLPGSEALAIITHGQAHRCSRILQLNGDLPGATMFHRVGNGFLTYAEQIDLYWPGEAHRATLYREVDLRLLARDERLDNLR